MKFDLLKSIELSDPETAIAAFDERITAGVDPWKLHLSLFQTAQKVQNPPFVIPHLAKMHAVYRELVPRIEPEDVGALVRIEISEYARRPKMAAIPPYASENGAVRFEEIESALSANDPEKAARLMMSFTTQNGILELARKMLILGSGYLGESLGHSVSCAAFVLGEAMAADTHEDVWPALYRLADYYQKGGFCTMPSIQADSISTAEMKSQLLRAASGCGTVNLHHTITIYAIESVSDLLTDEEHNHLIRSWIAMMGEKEVAGIPEGAVLTGKLLGYPMFYALAASLDSRATLSGLYTLVDSKTDRARLAQYLVKAVCDLYQGDYNPHYFIGLGSVLWVLDRFHEDPRIVANALYQYLEYLFTDLEPRLVNPPLDI